MHFVTIEGVSTHRYPLQSSFCHSDRWSALRLLFAECGRNHWILIDQQPDRAFPPLKRLHGRKVSTARAANFSGPSKRQLLKNNNKGQRKYEIENFFFPVDFFYDARLQYARTGRCRRMNNLCRAENLIHQTMSSLLRAAVTDYGYVFECVLR